MVAFSGRETDVPNGIWGEIARQLGKEQAFKDYYSSAQGAGPLRLDKPAQGRAHPHPAGRAPPYLDNAKSVSIGNSDLSKVTATALTNLFEAIAEADLANVCVVITDLVGTYAEASAQIKGLLAAASKRGPAPFHEPHAGADEHRRVLPDPPQAPLQGTARTTARWTKVAQEYAKAVREAKQMDITAQSPEQFAALIKSSYPFHPAIKDLYARFRENRGFQQTRALIRLMRIITSGLWKSDEADKKYLIAVQDLNLNDAETLSEIRQINPNLENAVAHDIAAQGKAVAEVMDQT